MKRLSKRDRFLLAVTEAVRAARPVKPRGTPMPANLSEAGRRKGLEAIRNAPRCQSMKRDGTPCSQPAVRGARRCAIHGGRVEVPSHPSNIRRFMTGTLTVAVRTPRTKSHGEELWEAMSWRERREFLDKMPDHIRADDDLLFKALTILNPSEEKGSSVHMWRLWLQLSDPQQAGRVIV